MALTQIADIIQPEIWLPYTVQRTVALSELMTSGILEASAEFDNLVNGPNTTADMPFWNDLTGSDEVLADGGTALTPAKLTTGQDRAVKLIRGRAWENNDLVKYLAGDDPARVIGDLVASYWAIRAQVATLSILKGVFAASSMSANLAAIHKTTGGAGAQTAANTLNAETFIDACQKLGDAKAQLSAMIMHSAVEADLRKQDLIDFLPASEQGKPIPIFQGHRVIIDDSMPTQTVDSDTVFTTYIFGMGALAYGVGDLMAPAEGGHGTWGAEFYRDPLKGNSGLITRRRMIIHPRGVKWNDGTVSVAGITPTNSEMEASNAWVRAFDPKKIRIVKVTHNIGA